MSAAARPALLPADAAERRRALDPARSFIVQAPAGSGKTTLLVERFLTLLAAVEQPEQIVAITFTRKAAAEMRARIVAALERGAGEQASEAARAAVDRDRQLGWNLRQHPARLRIQTIDSLCASLVQRMPWLARTGGMPRIEDDATELYREASHQTLAHLARGGPAAEAVRRLLLHLDNNYRIARTMFEQLLARRDQWLRYIGAGTADPVALRAMLEESLGLVVAQGIEKVAARIPPLVQSRIAALHDFSQPAEAHLGGARDLAAWQAVAGFLLTGNNQWRKTVTASQGFPPHCRAEKNEFLEIVASLSQESGLLEALVDLRKLPAARFPDEQWRLLEALLTLLPVSAAELKLVFRERGQVDFVELGEAARAALGPPEYPSDLALSLGDRLAHLLVDEFQDTSVSQFELFERLVAGWDPAATGGMQTLFLVGDPMQSIYRFREAEVGLFLRARTDGVGAVACEPLRLQSNFRSRPALVDWVNGAFVGIFPPAEDSTMGAVTYSASVPARAPDTSAAVRIHPFFTADEEPEAAAVAALAEESLTRGASTAVLVRARSHALATLAEFARRRLPFRAVEFDPLIERPVIADLLALTRALLHPGDRTAWLAVLRAPWCGLTLAELHDLVGPDPRAIVWDRLSHASGSRLDRLCAALAPAMAAARRVPLRACVEGAWQRLGGPAIHSSPQDLADALRYCDLLESCERGGEVAFDLLARRLAQLYALTPPATGPAVDVMTIHKAKGLEWDTVIVPGLGRDAAGDAPPLLRWSEAPLAGGGTRLLLAPIGATRDEENDPIFAYLARLERHRARHETARLLYVAATRAREQLHWLGHIEPTAKGEIRPRTGTLLHLLWPVAAPEFTAMNPEPTAPSTAAEPLDQTLRRVPEDWQPEEDPRPPLWESPRAEDATEEVTFDWAGDTLRHAGTVTHRWLERIARSGHAALPTPAAIRAELDGLGLPADETAEASAIVERALEQTLASERGRWLLLASHAEAACELRVCLHEDGVVHYATIDRTFVDEHGTRWVIDYKTGTHQGSDTAAFLDREQERYRPRLERYARYFRAVENRPLRLALYYPMLDGWRAWEPA